MTNTVKQLPRLLALVAVMAFSATGAFAGTMTDSGSIDATYAKRDAQPIPDQPGHVLLLTDAVGTNTNTSGSPYLDGFSFDVREIMDLAQGNGRSRGYVTFTKGNTQQIVKINGHVSTVMKDGQPNTTFKGKWTVVKATGSYAGVQGDGTYAGYFTAENKFHVDWQGWHTKLESLADAQ